MDIAENETQWKKLKKDNNEEHLDSSISWGMWWQRGWYWYAVDHDATVAAIKTWML